MTIKYDFKDKKFVVYPKELHSNDTKNGDHKAVEEEDGSESTSLNRGAQSQHAIRTGNRILQLYTTQLQCV